MHEPDPSFPPSLNMKEGRKIGKKEGRKERRKEGKKDVIIGLIMVVGCLIAVHPFPQPPHSKPSTTPPQSYDLYTQGQQSRSAETAVRPLQYNSKYASICGPQEDIERERERERERDWVPGGERIKDPGNVFTVETKFVCFSFSLSGPY